MSFTAENFRFEEFTESNPCGCTQQWQTHYICKEMLIIVV